MAKVNNQKKMIAKICLVEGETEIIFIKSLGLNRLKAQKFNPWENYFRKISARITSITDIYLIIDMDKITIGKASHVNNIQGCQQQLLANLKVMSQHKNIRSIILLYQYDSLEDELMRGLGRSGKAFYRFFDAEGLNEVKDHLIKWGHERLRLKLEAANFMYEKLWRSENVDHQAFRDACLAVHSKVQLGSYSLLIS
ncbi:hypothetical protein J7554_04305 [Wohlfahrtiimonas chitiniclastica]|uniref:hypothetical protein n=1 Tax=Wohlfahrtiimonas chitiniclastica TaxID=400946 RepID=UPI001BD04376|nr:hypothetical protein [Wohlfahrtiimonas chitiniclastica]MBS7820034.1 hypothetical protein [Wohlfahrtiimonas chitiniclastica]MBS7828342.1 hypothetical protein [Wohlfahrtiimonas chitiniclastica]